jgi:hypothetical protein
VAQEFIKSCTTVTNKNKQGKNKRTMASSSSLKFDGEGYDSSRCPLTLLSTGGVWIQCPVKAGKTKVKVGDLTNVPSEYKTHVPGVCSKHKKMIALNPKKKFPVYPHSSSSSSSSSSATSATEQEELETMMDGLTKVAGSTGALVAGGELVRGLRILENFMRAPRA